MGRKLFIFFVAASLIFAFSSLGFSQGSLKFGFRGGLNMANVSEDVPSSLSVPGLPIDLNVEKKMRMAFGFGGFMEYWFSPMFALQFNALYSMKGVKITADIDETITVSGIPVNVKGDAEEMVKLSYLSFPILTKLAFGQSGSIQPFIIAGPEIGILLSAKDKASGEITATAMGQTATESFDEETDIKEFLESMEFAINFGAGVIIPLGSVEMFVDGRYGLGLTKINKEGDDMSIKNNVIYVNIGFAFGGK